MNLATSVVSSVAKQAAARAFGCSIDDLTVTPVNGGYSRNRRSIVAYNGKWLFAKEVDKDVLDGDGAEELRWLKKDYQLTDMLRTEVPELVSDWAQLYADDHVLLMSSYRQEDGWLWSLPADPNTQGDYIHAVIDATRRLESVTLNTAPTDHLALEPYFRDKLAHDEGLSQLLSDETLRTRLIEKYTALIVTESRPWLVDAYAAVRDVLHDPKQLQVIASIATGLIKQPDDRFNHCDVRSDNIAYHPGSGKIKFVDWNWASYAPARFGSTEFLIDMARHGVDVSKWKHELNRELLAATVGFYARRCLEPPLAPGSTLRDMQAESAAIAVQLLSMLDT